MHYSALLQRNKSEFSVKIVPLVSLKQPQRHQTGNDTDTLQEWLNNTRNILSNNMNILLMNKPKWIYFQEIIWSENSQYPLFKHCEIHIMFFKWLQKKNRKKCGCQGYIVIGRWVWISKDSMKCINGDGHSNLPAYDTGWRVLTYFNSNWRGFRKIT